MATTQNDIRGWLNEGKKQGATHMLVVCDTYDHEDYPVYVKAGQSAKDLHAEYVQGKHSMQRVMECYSLGKDIEPQLAERRAFHFD